MIKRHKLDEKLKEINVHIKWYFMEKLLHMSLDKTFVQFYTAVLVICTQKYDDFSFLNSISVRMLATCFQETVYNRCKFILSERV